MRTLNALWQSFFSPALYRNAYHSWKGICFLLITLLVTLHTLVLILKIHVGLGNFIRNDVPAFVNQLPELRFSNGLASTPEAKTYEILDQGKGGIFAIINTQIEHPPADLGGAHIYVAQKSVTLKKNEFENRSYDFKSLDELVVNQTLINHWLTIASNWTAVVCAPFIFGFFLVYRMLQLLFFSLIALAAGAILKVAGNYASTLRLTALALTPPILILGILASAIDLDFPGIGVLFFAVATGYIFWGTHAARNDNQGGPLS